MSEVILLDDSSDSAFMLQSRWAGSNVRVLHTADLSVVTSYLGGGRVDGWPDRPELLGVLLDINLGSGDWAGVQAAAQLRTHAATGWPVVLRTAPLTAGTRDLAAALIAELLGPTPWWPREDADQQILDFLLTDQANNRPANSATRIVNARRHGADHRAASSGTILEPVRTLVGNRSQPLGRRLIGSHPMLWTRMVQGYDKSVATYVRNTGLELRNTLAGLYRLAKTNVLLHQCRGAINLDELAAQAQEAAGGANMPIQAHLSGVSELYGTVLHQRCVIDAFAVRQ